jgi:hypothetical protein
MSKVYYSSRFSQEACFSADSRVSTETELGFVIESAKARLAKAEGKRLDNHQRLANSYESAQTIVDDIAKSGEPMGAGERMYLDFHHPGWRDYVAIPETLVIAA